MHFSWKSFFNLRVLRSIVIFGLIFAYGYKFRALHPEYVSLGFDQIQILQSAALIHQGHFVLLGPRTGPAPMYTGPLIYYVAAFLLNFTPAPFVLVPTILALYTITFIISFILVKRYFDDKILRWIFLALLAFSPYQIFLDRVPWNPNISFLAAALVFLPLFYKTEKKLGIIDIVFVMLGCFLGYQAHFSGLLLPGFVIVAWVIWYRKQWYLPLLAILSLVASVVPTAIFDRRHDYPNLHGFLFILQQRGTNSGPPMAWYERFAKDCLVTLENTGKIIGYTAPYYILITLGVTFFAIFICMYRKKYSQFIWPLIWILGLNIVFMFYQGPKPEYYFLLQFPALFYIVAQVVRPLLKNNLYALMAVVGFGLYAYFSTTYQLKNPPMLYLQNQVDATQKVREYQKQTNSIVVYDMSVLDSQGMRYLLPDLPSGSATTSTQTTHLVYPYDHDSPISNDFGKLAVWQDPRIDESKNYLVRKRLLIVSPKDTTFLESHYHQTVVEPADTEYEVERNDQKIGRLFFLDDKQSNGTYNDFMSENMHQWDRQQKKWQPVKINGQEMYVLPTAGTTMIMLFTDSKMNTGDQVNFLHTISTLYSEE